MSSLQCKLVLFVFWLTNDDNLFLNELTWQSPYEIWLDSTKINVWSTNEIVFEYR